MSIITDALNQLQAERAWRPGQHRASTTPDSAAAVGFRDSSVHPPAGTHRNRLSFLLLALGGVGLAGYLWGLPLIASPNRMSPEQGTVKESKPVQHVPSRRVEAIPEQREEPFTAPEAEASENPKPPESASASDPPAKMTPVAQKVSVRKSRSSPGVGSTAKPSLAHDTHSALSTQRRNRKATPLEVKLARAQYFMKKRQYAQAVTVLQPLFLEPPERWEPWFWLGTAQLGLGQLAKARMSLVEGLARDATVPQLWVQRALVSQQQDRFGEALDALRQAELLAPKLPEVHLNLAYALEVEGNRLLAVKHYRTFLTLTEGKKGYHSTRKKVLDRISRL